MTEREADNYAAAMTIPEWEDYFMNHMQALAPSRMPEVIKLSKTTVPGSAPDTKPTVERRLFTSDNFSMVVEFYVEKPKPKTKPDMPKFTKEELLAMLAELDK